MAADTIEARVAQLIAETLAIAPAVIEPDARFIEDLGANSLDIAQLLSLVEGEFHRTIPDEILGDLQTVADLVALLRRT